MGDNLPSKTFTLVCIVSLSPDKKNKIAILAKRFNDELKLYVARYHEFLQRIIENVQSDSTSNSPSVDIVIENPIIIDHNTGQQPLPVIPSNLAPEHPQVVIIEMPKLDSGSSIASIKSGVKDTINTLLTTEQDPEAAVITIDENEEQFQKMIDAITKFLKGDDKKGGNKQSRSFRNSSSRSSHRRASSRSSKKRTTKRNLKRRQRSAYRRTR